MTATGASTYKLAPSMIRVVKEIDDFLLRWVTPMLRQTGYRKSHHMYRKRFGDGDWAVFSFRDYPLPNARGSFLAEASFVPARLLEWFNYSHPTQAMKQPTGWLMYWSNPLPPSEGHTWAYESDAERELCAAELIDRLHAVAGLFQRFGENPKLLASAVLEQKPPALRELSTLASHFHHPAWRAAVLVDRGSSPELRQAVADADQFPALRLRDWVQTHVDLGGSPAATEQEPAESTGWFQIEGGRYDYLLSGEHGAVASASTFHLDGREYPIRVLSTVAVFVQLDATAAGALAGDLELSRLFRRAGIGACVRTCPRHWSHSLIGYGFRRSTETPYWCSAAKAVPITPPSSDSDSCRTEREGWVRHSAEWR
jgi:hypothetical protein